MNRISATAEILNIFGTYKSLLPADQQLLTSLSDGKLYELYVLSHLVSELSARGFTLTFSGTTLEFKASPGMIKSTDPHFEVSGPGGTILGLYVDIEFLSLGTVHVPVTDYSSRHEVDLILVTVNQGYPKHDEILLGVECKAVANFSKSIVKEVLGVRREMSYLTASQPSALSFLAYAAPVVVPADPPSEYWLAYIDPKGNRYRESPAAFGVEFRHFQP